MSLRLPHPQRPADRWPRWLGASLRAAAGLALLAGAAAAAAQTAVPAGEAPPPTAQSPSPSPSPSPSVNQSPSSSEVTALLAKLLPTPLLMLGEQHDHPAHQRLQLAVLQQLQARQGLSALVLEMVEHGHSTQGLAPTADEAEVQRALNWARGWPWADYRALVMAAVRAGVVVWGGNLPRAEMRSVMADSSWDARVAPAVWAHQIEAMRNGHCGLLPESQFAPMARIQLARDQRMAATAVRLLHPGKTVLLVAGNGHVRRDVGLALHLPADLAARALMALPEGAAAEEGTHDLLWRSPTQPERDHCAEMRKK